MRRKKTAAAVWAAAVIVMVAGGCQKKYEAIDLRPEPRQPGEQMRAAGS